jgi:hypothetical protein
MDCRLDLSPNGIEGISMTLILSLANRKYTIQLSDRRITSDSQSRGNRIVVTEEANKAGTLSCADAYLAYSFTGLARTNSNGRHNFDTRRWLLEAILKAAPPDFQIVPMLGRFCEIATQEFKANAAILAHPKGDRGLSVMFSGFWNTNQGQIPAGWIITNFQRRFDYGIGHPNEAEAWDEFRCWRWHQPLPAVDQYAHVERLGSWRGVSDASMDRLEDLLRQEKPVAAIIGSALKVIYKASDAPPTQGTVGKNVNIIVIPADTTEPIGYSYESNKVTTYIYCSDSIIAKSHNQQKWFTLWLSAEGPVIPRGHRKSPCKCGSGLTYERCHRRFRSDIRRSHQRLGK